jgi:hypothetical protein
MALLEEQSARWQRGEHVLVEDYLARQPGLHANSEAMLDLITSPIATTWKPSSRS